MVYRQIRGLKENVFFKNVSNFYAKKSAKKFYNVQEDAKDSPWMEPFVFLVNDKYFFLSFPY